MLFVERACELTLDVDLMSSANNLNSIAKSPRINKAELHSFSEWVPNINCVFMCLPSFSKLHLLAIDLRWLQNCCSI